VVIAEIEGIGPTYAARFEAADIHSVEALLAAGATRRGRRQLAGKTDIREELILEWVNHADLMRIDGVGPQYADLLEAAGVDSPAELAHRNAANLALTFQEVEAARHLVNRSPSEEMVRGWIEQARALDTVVEH
jgi:predicted flap endonuclease-1-like 5' DNA nuclease